MNNVLNQKIKEREKEINALKITLISNEIIYQFLKVLKELDENLAVLLCEVFDDDR